MLEGQSTRAVLALLAEQPTDQAEAVTLQLLAGLEVAEMARIVGKRPRDGVDAGPSGLRRLAGRVEAAGLRRP